MLTADFEQVHVNDFATLKVLMEECNYHIPSLCDQRQKFTFNDLSVGAMSKCLVSLLFLVVSLHRFDPLLFQTAHNFFRLFVHEVVEIVVVLR